MAIHITAINGMGGSTLSGGVIVNTGMKAEDHMHIAEDFIANAGVLRDGDMLASQNGTPNRSVNISPGIAYVLNSAWTTSSLTETKFYRIKTDTTDNVSISVNASGLPRITSIFLRVDPTITPDGNGSNVASYVTVDGTPNASPTAPATPVDGKSYLRLANITCANAYTQILNANIANIQVPVSANNISAPAVGLINGRITATVASNNLTVNVVALNGDTPSTTNPVFVYINGTRRTVNSALTLTINGGTYQFAHDQVSVAIKTWEIFVCLLWDSVSSVVRLGLTRAVLSNQYSVFSSTATDVNALILSGGSPLSTDILQCVGRINLTSNVNNYTSVNNIILTTSPDTSCLTWLPVPSGGGSMTTTSPTFFVCRYQITGDRMEVWLHAALTLGGTANAAYYFTNPYRRAIYGTPIQGHGSGTAVSGVTLKQILLNDLAPTPNTIAIQNNDGAVHGLGANVIRFNISLFLV